MQVDDVAQSGGGASVATATERTYDDILEKMEARENFLEQIKADKIARPNRVGEEEATPEQLRVQAEDVWHMPAPTGLCYATGE